MKQMTDPSVSPMLLDFEAFGRITVFILRALSLAMTVPKTL
jgi:hypothetical protein